MSTTERLQPAEQPDRGGQNLEPAGGHFQEPKPTAPFELPTGSSRSLRVSELLKHRAVRAAAAVIGFATAAGLVVMAAGRTEVIAGTPVGLGHGGDAPAAGPLAPGAEKPGNPEVVTGSLCDQVPLYKLAEWTTGVSTTFPPKEELTCNGEIPVNTNVPEGNIVASGEWGFPATGEYSFPVDEIRMQVMKDAMPDGGSLFEQRRMTFAEDPHTRIIGDTEVTVMSSGGTTLVNVPQPDGSSYDLSFTIRLPVSGGYVESPYPPLHRGELQSLPELLPLLNLVPQD